MSKDYERLCASAEAYVYAAMIRLMVRRLARAREFPNSFSRHFGELRARVRRLGLLHPGLLTLASFSSEGLIAAVRELR
jgi:hypothetical protein